MDPQTTPTEPQARRAALASPPAAPSAGRAATRSSSGIAFVARRDPRARSTRLRPTTRRACSGPTAEAGSPLPPVRGPGRAAARSTATPTSPRTTARARASPAPRTSAAPRPARSSGEGAIRVCDLFDKPLVISFWFTPRRRLPAEPGRASTRSPARYGDQVNFLSINVRDEREEVRRDRPRARLGACRSATTPTAPSPTSTGSAAARPRARLPGRHPRRRRRRRGELRPEALGERVDELIAESEKRARATGERVDR